MSKKYEKKLKSTYKIPLFALPLLLFLDASVVFRQIVFRCEFLQIFFANQDLQVVFAFNTNTATQ